MNKKKVDNIIYTLTIIANIILLIAGIQDKNILQIICSIFLIYIILYEFRKK